MAGDWIKIERDLPHKPEVMQLAQILGVDELQVVGHLVLFWSWCDANMSLDCPYVSGTKRGLDRASCRDGMVDAMVLVGWLEMSEDNGQERYRIPNFERHLSKSAKTRANEQRKKQRQRSCPDTNGTSVPFNAGTKPGLEKRREEKSKTTTPEVVVPSALNSPEFHEAWNTWFNYRRELKKPLTSASVKQQLKKFATWGQSRAIAAIEHTIEMGWQGLREPEAAAKAQSQICDDWHTVMQTVKSTYSVDVKNIGDLEKRLTPEQFAAVKLVTPRRIVDWNEFDKETPAAYRRARNGA